MAIRFRNWALCLLLFNLQEIKGQLNPVYRDFNLTVNNKQVRIDFVLTEGSTCTGIFIYRSQDTTQMYLIGEIPGDCGSPAEPVHYSFIDYNPPLNLKIYYRIVFGGTFFSEFKSTTVPEGVYGKILLTPNPLNIKGKLYFENTKGEIRRIVFRNALGISVSEFTTIDDFFEFDTSELISGIYLIEIYNNEKELLAVEKASVIK